MPDQRESLDPSDLILPSDYKPSIEDLESMKVSLQEQGLINPVTVKDNREVVAGKLRVLAARGILEFIDCKVIPSNLTEDEYHIISLHENLKRYNLPWYEQVVKEKELHDIRQKQFGVGQRGKKNGWSMRDTSEELGIALGVISEDIRLAEAVMNDPSLRRIQDKTTAKKVIFETVKRVSQDLGANRPVNFEVNTCHFGYSDAILRCYPNDSFDACITDPPWLEFKDPSLTRDQFTLPVFKEVFRVLKQNAFLYMFVSTQDWIFYAEELPKIGFSVQKFPLIWVKEGVLTHGRKTWEYQRDYEPILLAAKGSPATTSSFLSAVFSCKVVPSQNLRHPNEKPPEVIKRILNDCSFDGAIVVDPFAGSFVVPDVCQQMRRRYVAIEKDKKFYAAGLERLGKINNDSGQQGITQTP